MITNKYNKVAAGVVFSLLFPLSSFLFIACSDLEYTSQSRNFNQLTLRYQMVEF